MIFKVEFDEQVWGTIINMLATQPYKDAGPIIAAIANQFQAQREGNGVSPPPVNPGETGQSKRH